MSRRGFASTAIDIEPLSGFEKKFGIIFQILVMEKSDQKTEFKTHEWFDEQDLRYFMSLSAEEKLNQLEELQNFFNSVVNPEGDKLWEQLQAEGF